MKGISLMGSKKDLKFKLAKLLAQKENLLVLGHCTTLFASPVIQSGRGCSKGG